MWWTERVYGEERARFRVPRRAFVRLYRSVSLAAIGRALACTAVARSI